jgi:hypothetical protein
MRKAILISVFLGIMLSIDSSTSSLEILVKPPFPERGYEEIMKRIEYPPIAAMAWVEPHWMVEVFIDLSGKVITVRRKEGKDGYDPNPDRRFFPAIEKAIRSVKWNPAMHHGNPVSSKVEIPIVYVVVMDSEMERWVPAQKVPVFRGQPVILTEEIPNIPPVTGPKTHGYIPGDSE